MAFRSNDTIDQVITNVGLCLGYEQVKEEQRQGVKAIIEGRDVFVAQPTVFPFSSSFSPPPIRLSPRERDWKQVQDFPYTAVV